MDSIKEIVQNYEENMNCQIKNVTELQNEIRSISECDVDDEFLKQLDLRIAEMKRLASELKKNNQDLCNKINK